MLYIIGVLQPKKTVLYFNKLDMFFHLIFYSSIALPVYITKLVS